jgi:hypothetical protein
MITREALQLIYFGSKIVVIMELLTEFKRRGIIIPVVANADSNAFSERDNLSV